MRASRTNRRRSVTVKMNMSITSFVSIFDHILQEEQHHGYMSFEVMVQVCNSTSSSASDAMYSELSTGVRRTSYRYLVVPGPTPDNGRPQIPVERTNMDNKGAPPDSLSPFLLLIKNERQFANMSLFRVTPRWVLISD